MSRKRFGGWMLMVMCIVLIFTASATASKKTITLTYGSPFPKVHPASMADIKWMEKIKEETNGSVEIKPFWGGSLVSVREAFDEVTQGVADIGSISLNYSPAGFDLNITEQIFYYGTPSIEILRRVYHEIHAKYPEDKKLSEVKVLARGQMPPYHALTNKPVRKTDDFKGLSLKSLPHLIGPLKELGAEGVALSMFDVYVALEKGTIHGLFGPYETLKSMRLGEVVKYCTYLNISNGIGAQRVMNLKKWNSLPPDVQKVLEDNIEWWGYEIMKMLSDADSSGIEFAKKQGVEFIQLPAEELKKFYELLEEVAKKQAADLDAKGIPGTEIFKETRSLIEKYSK